jgi:hypothetical protein
MYEIYKYVFVFVRAHQKATVVSSVCVDLQNVEDSFKRDLNYFFKGKEGKVLKSAIKGRETESEQYCSSNIPSNNVYTHRTPEL